MNSGGGVERRCYSESLGAQAVCPKGTGIQDGGCLEGGETTERKEIR